MRKYLGTYGMHFNKKLCEDVVSMMRDRKGDALKPVSKEMVNEMLNGANVRIEHAALHDAVYVYSMAMADYWGSSISDEQHLALFIKDYIDDPDGYDGIAFHRWYADCCKKGIVIDWEEYL